MNFKLKIIFRILKISKNIKILNVNRFLINLNSFKIKKISLILYW
jgi:hypothetical protein